LSTRRGLEIRQHIEHHGCVAVHLGGNRRGGENEDRRGDRLTPDGPAEAGHYGHAADPRRAIAGAPKMRGNNVITAGTTNTSARNATAIVSASSPPNQAVGL